MVKTRLRLESSIVILSLLAFDLSLPQDASADQRVSIAIRAEAKAITKVEIQVDAPFSGKEQPPVRSTKVVCPGTVALDFAGLKDQRYSVILRANGFAERLEFVSLRGRIVEPKQIEVTLFKKRYAIIEYAINRKGGRSLTGPDVETGLFAVSHSGGLPRFEEDWRIDQGGEDLSINPHRINTNFGFAPSLRGRKYSELTEAPNPLGDKQRNNGTSVYQPELIPVEKGLILFARIQGDGVWGKGGLFGKLRVIDIVREPPKGMQTREAQ